MKNKAFRISKLMSWLILLFVAAPLLLLISCQSKLIYFPRAYPAGTVGEWQQQTRGKLIDYQTSQGKQQAYLQGNLKSPRNLWIFCGGNGTVALDWAEWLETHAPREDAWLLVDFPGYGNCAGRPNPERIAENLRTAVPAAAQALGWHERLEPERLRFFGHSLGAAACMIAATEFQIQRGVLLTPFTSTMDMSQHMLKLPLGFIVRHRFDNRTRMKELAARGPGKVVIVHGTDDEAIPFWMGRALATENPQTARIIEIPGGRHNTISQTHPQELMQALREAE